MQPLDTLKYFQSKQKQMMEDLRTWVEIESPTSDKPSVDRFGKVVSDRFKQLGMKIEWKEAQNRGNHLIARWGSSEQQLLLIGHLDTVWELGTLQRFPWSVDGDIGRGPGIFDMKAGVIITLYALQLIKEQERNRYPITVLLDSDEEEGSESSRTLIEDEARTARAAFVLEPSGPDHGIKTKRRGVGRFTITAHGRAAHAGVEPEKGINAIEEISYQIIEIQGWNQQRSGISINADLIQGGTRTNVIPETAEIIVAVRCDSIEDVQWLEEKFRGLTAKKPGARLRIDGGIERPPLERNEKVLGLYEQAKQIGDAMNYPLTEFWTGGGSDGNLTAALGVPTLDGMGAEGGGAHALSEHIFISSLPKRTALLYHMILNQFE
jgi:glutamate carboxypeptidase